MKKLVFILICRMSIVGCDKDDECLNITKENDVATRSSVFWNDSTENNGTQSDSTTVGLTFNVDDAWDGDSVVVF